MSLTKKKLIGLVFFIGQTALSQNFSEQWQYVQRKNEASDVLELVELWNYYTDNPINLKNKTELNLLAELNLLEETELNTIQQFCKKHSISSIYQLQILEIELESLRRIKPFIYTSKQNVSKSKEVKTSGFASIQFETPKRRGLIEHKYLGSGIKSRIRYRAIINNQWRIGFAIEKDIGEPTQYKNKGLNNTVLNIQFKGERSLKQVSLGKYDITIGEGLLFGTSYRINNPYFLSYKYARVIKSNLSPKEYNYFKGAAARWEKNKYTINLFASSRRPNGLTSYDNTGQFRTHEEIEKYKNLNQDLVGVNLLRSTSQSKYTWAGILYKSSLSGNKPMLLQSVYFSKNYYNIEFTGEIATQDLYAWANFQKINISAGKNSFLTMQYRSRDAGMLNEFKSNYTGFSNGYEKGFYYALLSSIQRNWTFKLAFDTYKSTQLQATSPHLEEGVKVMSELARSTKKNKLVCQFQHKKITQRNPIKKLRLFYHINWDKQIRWNTKLYCVSEDKNLNTALQFNLFWTSKNNEQKISFSNCIFSTKNESIFWQAPHFFGSYNARFLSGKGSVYSISVQKKIKANLKFGFQTIVLNYNDRIEIGTGNETITNNKKLDFTIYLKWNTKTK